MTSLRSSALSGIRWTLGARIALQLISWPITLISMRALDPKDYGLLALTMVVVGVISVAADLGLSVVLVQSRDLSEAESRSAAGVALISSMFFVCVLWLIAPWAAKWFQEPELALLIRVMSVDVLATAMAAVPQVHLERSLRFRELSLSLLFSGVVGVLATLGGALLGWGVWALILGTLLTTIVRCTMQIAYHGGIVVPSMHLGLLCPYVERCAHIVGSRALWFWHSQADQIVLGRMLQATAVGHFMVAAQLATLPVTKAMDTLNRVALPTLSRLQGPAAGLSSVHSRLLGLTAAYAFLACWGLAAIADGLIPLLLGERWRAAAVLLELLAVIAPLRMISAVQNTAATAAGHPQAVTKELLLASTLIPAAVYVGASTGDVTNAARAWALAYPLVYGVSTWLTARAVGVPLGKCLRPIVGPVGAGLTMLGTVLILETTLQSQLHPIALLIGSVAVGVAAYCATLAVLAPRTYAEARGLLVDLARRATSAR